LAHTARTCSSVANSPRSAAAVGGGLPDFAGWSGTLR
jgi:hypothetical protein